MPMIMVRAPGASERHRHFSSPTSRRRALHTWSRGLRPALVATASTAKRVPVTMEWRSTPRHAFFVAFSRARCPRCRRQLPSHSRPRVRARVICTHAAPRHEATSRHSIVLPIAAPPRYMLISQHARSSRTCIPREHRSNLLAASCVPTHASRRSIAHTTSPSRVPLLAQRSCRIRLSYSVHY